MEDYAHKIARVTMVVSEYAEAIDFFTQKLGFLLIEDTKLSETKRWVVVAPKGSSGCQLLLAKANNEKQKQAIGNQTGGRVFMFLTTTSFWKDYHEMLKAGAMILERRYLSHFAFSIAPLSQLRRHMEIALQRLEKCDMMTVTVAETRIKNFDS